VRVDGLLLAAGAGRRMGTPKALVGDDAGLWLPRGVRALRDGGCTAVTVVLGAVVEEAVRLLAADQPASAPGAGPDPLAAGVRVVVADDWAEGMGASLRAGLAAAAAGDAEAVVVHLVDLPDVGPAVVARLLGALAGEGRPAGAALARAAYSGVPGHPVLLGRDHWAGVTAGLSGDEGARGYLRSHPTLAVECGDLATGRDVDVRA
jgi:CTP:molybdopterin cytidylyltransferase MocA